MSALHARRQRMDWFGTRRAGGGGGWIGYQCWKRGGTANTATLLWRGGWFSLYIEKGCKEVGWAGRMIGCQCKKSAWRKLRSAHTALSLSYERSPFYCAFVKKINPRLPRKKIPHMSQHAIPKHRKYDHEQSRFYDQCRP